MTLDEFRASLTQDEPPEGLPPALGALWHDARGDWDAAHGVAQNVTTRDGAWVHAYLHRKEGDPSNAAYWYRVANQPASTDPLDVEWAAIVNALLRDM